ncbi:MAG: hypothetical protein R3C25_09640 [Hyphomonadaceae bacterium]
MKPRGGIWGMLLLFCAAALLAGLALDIGAGARADFWIAAQAGAPSALGAGVAVFAIVASRLAGMAHGQRETKRRGGDADADA